MEKRKTALAHVHADASKLDAFELEQCPLQLARLAGKKDPAFPAEYSLPGQSLLAGAAQRPGDLPGGPRVTGRGGDLAVGRHLAPRDAADDAPDIFKVAHAIQTVTLWRQDVLFHHGDTEDTEISRRHRRPPCY